MQDKISVDNFTPITQHHNSPKRKRPISILLLPVIFVLTIAIGLVSFLLFQKEPQITTAPAAESDSVTCDGDYHYGWLIYYTFTDQGSCQSCADNRETCLLPHVGELQKCFDGSGTICRSIGDGGTMSTAIPACSVAQLDCVNKSYNEASANDRGSIGSGHTTFNCNCAPPVTSPPVTSPPVTSPPVTSPPVTSPPVTSPPVTSPPVTSPPVTSPPVTSPPVTSPPVTSPPVTSPPVTSPPVGTLVCGTKGCRDNTNPCKPGLVCVAGPDENYCSLPQLTTQCKQSGTYDSCCNAGGGGTLTCGEKGCRDSNNPCQNGLTCVVATDENYCAMPSLTSACKTNPTFQNCCSVPTSQVQSTQPITTVVAAQPTLPQTGGEKRWWFLIPAAIILFGLVF